LRSGASIKIEKVFLSDKPRNDPELPASSTTIRANGPWYKAPCASTAAGDRAIRFFATGKQGYTVQSLFETGQWRDLPATSDGCDAGGG